MVQRYDVNNDALTSTFNNQIGSRNRWLKYRVFVDWNRTGFNPDDALQDISKYVVSIDTQRNLTTDLPSQSRLTAGTVAATCDIELGGHTAVMNKVTGQVQQMTGAQLWHPYSKISPFYGLKRAGAPVQVWLGLPSAIDPVTNLPTDYQYVYHFTGYISQKPTTTASSATTLNCVDGSDRLHGSTPLPMVLAGDAFGITTARYGLNAQWIIDYILRRNGIYASPPTTDDTIVSTTMHGSMFPEVGDPITAQIFPFGSAVAALESPPFVQGLWGLACTSVRQDGSGTFVTPTVDVKPKGTPVLDGTTGGLQVEFVMYVGASYSGTGDFSQQNLFFSVDNTDDWMNVMLMDDGTLRVWIRGGEDVIVGPHADNGTAAWRYLGVHIKFNSATSVTCTFNVSGVTTVVTKTITSGSWTAGAKIVDIGSSANAAIESIMWKYRTTPSFTWMSFIPNAVLEKSLNQLTVCPYDPDGTDAWNTITDIVAAELGFAGFNEAGIFRFRNRYSRNQPFSYTLPASLFMYGTNSLKDAQAVESTAGIANIVSATATPYSVQAPTWVWTLGDVLRVPARTTVTIWASFQSAVFGTPTSASFLPTGTPDPTTGAFNGNFYRASTTRDGKGAAVSNLIITVTPFIDSARIDIQNPNRGQDAWIVAPTRDPNGALYADQSQVGTPMLYLWGRAVVDSTDNGGGNLAGSISAAASETDERSRKDYGDQEYDIPNSKWLQSVRSARDLVLEVLTNTCRPIPQVPQIAAIFDPRLELKDTLGIVTEGWDGVNNTGYVSGIHTTISKDAGGAMELLFRMAGGPEGWVLGDSTWPSSSPVHNSQSILGQTTILGGKV